MTWPNHFALVVTPLRQEELENIGGGNGLRNREDGEFVVEDKSDPDVCLTPHTVRGECGSTG